MATWRLARIGAIVWSLSLVLYVAAVVGIYPSLGTTPELQAYYKVMPDEFMAILGITDIAELFEGGVLSLEGFMATEYFFLWPILMAVYALTVGTGLLSRELERGTMDLLLSQPIRRRQLLLSKFIAYATIFAGLSLLSGVTIIIGGIMIGADLHLIRIVQVHLVGFLFSVAILSYSTFCSAIFLSTSKSLAVAGGATVLFYLLNVVGRIVDGLGVLSDLSLFAYFDPMALLSHGLFNTMGLVVYIGVAIVSMGASMLVFERRDLCN